MTSQVHLPPWAGLDEVFFQYLLYRGRALPPRLRFAAFRGLPSHTEKSYGFHALYPLPLLAECMLRTISVSCLIDRVTGRPYSEGPRGRQQALCGDMFDFHPGALGSTCTPRSLFSAASRCTPPKCLAWCSSTPTCPCTRCLGCPLRPCHDPPRSERKLVPPAARCCCRGTGELWRIGYTTTPIFPNAPNMRGLREPIHSVRRPCKASICAGFGSQSTLLR